MINISLITSLTESECIAEMRYIKPNGKEHKRSYTCERYTADSTHRAELKALVTGLKALRCSARVTAYLKTPHSIAAINQDWAKGWKNNDWKNAKGNLVRDWEVWKEIYEIIEAKEITLTGGMRSDFMGNEDQEISGHGKETGQNCNGSSAGKDQDGGIDLLCGKSGDYRESTDVNGSRSDCETAGRTGTEERRTGSSL